MAYGAFFKTVGWVYYAFIAGSVGLIGAVAAMLYGSWAFFAVCGVIIGPVWILAWREADRKERAIAYGGDQKSWRNQSAAIQHYVELVGGERDK